MESSKELANDSIYEILTRVSLETLLRQCKWVCKDWKKLLYDFNFKRVHCERTQTISGYFIQTRMKNKYSTSFVSITTKSSSPSIDFLPTDNPKIEAASPYGLLCCVSQDHRIPRYFVCKPATKQWTRIPNPKTRYTTERIAMLVKKSHPLHYQIVRFSSPKCKPGFHCEIFDSMNGSWKRSKDVDLPHLVLLELGYGIWLHGVFHWLTTNSKIFAFHLDHESWKMISLPQEENEMNDDFRIHKQLTECEGQIALLYRTCAWIELWVMEDYSKEIWKKTHRVSMESLNRHEPVNSLLAMDTKNVALINCYGKVIWYDCESGDFTEMKIRHETIQGVHPFRSDLVSSSLM